MITTGELVACRVIAVIAQIQGWLARTVCQIQYSFIFPILTCLGHSRHQSGGKGRQRFSFHNLERIQMERSVVSPIIFGFFCLSFFKKKTEKSSSLSSRVYQSLPRYLLLIKFFPCLDAVAEDRSLLLLSDSVDFWQNWRPLLKRAIGRPLVFPPSSWQCQPESNLVTLWPLASTVRPSARPIWVDASCIIDKVCLGRAPMGVCSWSAPLRAPSSSQAAGLKRDMFFVLFVSQHKTQPDSVIHLSFEACDWSV